MTAERGRDWMNKDRRMDPPWDHKETPPPDRRKQLLAWLWYRRWAAAVVAFALVLLTVLSVATQGLVDRHTQSDRELYCARVMPGAQTFSETPYSHDLARSIYAGYSGATLMGYCIEVQVDSFGGAMVLMVGVDTDGKVTGAAIESHNDDPDWAEQADSGDHMQQYVGRSGTIHYATVSGITGATTTSQAVTDGVNRALRVMSELDTEGGLQVGEEGEE